jgi:exodeoxyribonuclease VII large subunit
LVVGRKEDFLAELRSVRRRLSAAIKESYYLSRRRLDAAAGHYVFREPRNLVDQYIQRIDRLDMKMRHQLVTRHHGSRRQLEQLAARMGPQMQKQTNLAGRHLDQLEQRLHHHAQSQCRARRQELSRLQAQLQALNPLAVLQRGFSLTRNEAGELVRDSRALKQGERLSTRLASGTVISEVKETHDGQKN